MNALTKIEGTALAALNESELIGVLQSSLYPGASPDSIKMVLGYCKATGLDPMQKPVHIVPMWDSKAKQMRDVVMPGIGLYRTQAARTGRLAGITEPEFGPDKELTFGEYRITVPEWCRVTVRRLVDGEAREFTAREFWVENYATAGKDTTIPNAMWKKRPRGQLAKCAQAQALRMAFPEVGEQSTADEMEGKVLDMGAAEVVGAPPPPPPPPTAALPEFTEESLNQRLGKIAEFYKNGKKADEIIAFYSLKATLPDAMKQRIRDLAPKASDVTDVEPKGDTQKATYAALATRMHACANSDEATLILDEARALPADQQNDLSKIFDEKFGNKE